MTRILQILPPEELPSSRFYLRFLYSTLLLLYFYSTPALPLLVGSARGGMTEGHGWVASRADGLPVAAQRLQAPAPLPPP